MSTLIEIRWDADLERALCAWLVSDGQFSALTAQDVATSQTIELALNRRRDEARRAVQRLHTLLAAKAVKCLDAEVLVAGARLEKSAKATVCQAARSWANGAGNAGEIRRAAEVVEGRTDSTTKQPPAIDSVPPMAEKESHE